MSGTSGNLCPYPNRNRAGFTLWNSLDQKFIVAGEPGRSDRAILFLARGETKGGFAMTNLAGIVSILFIAAALWTSVSGVSRERSVLIVTSSE